MKKRCGWFGFFLILEFLALCAYAETELPVPRFVSARSGKINARVGPSKRYPVEWVFIQAGQPFEVLQHNENWRLVRNHEGCEGWVHQSMLSGLRTVIIKGKNLQNLYRTPHTEQKDTIVAQADPHVIGRLMGLEGEWCWLKIGDLKAWIPRDRVWGVYASEH